MFANSMFGYYVSLALRSLKRNKALTALMVIAIALGIGASMTTLTVFHVLSGDPIPQKSDKLFYPQIDPRSKEGYTAGDDPSYQMTRYDAEQMLREKRGDRQAMMTQGNAAIEPDKAGIPPFYADARFTTADFFAMFDAPFARGRGWTSAEEQARARVAVITTKLSEKLFGAGVNSVGKSIRMDQKEFKVIGVLREWRMAPRFYDMTSGSYSTDEQVFLPFWTAMSLQMDTSGNMDCWASNPDQDDKEGSRGVNAPCAWLQYWVELSTPAKVAAYKRYLINYSDQQRAAGRFQRPTNTRLHSVMEWLDENNVVPPDVRLQRWLAFGFLFVCLLNTVGLLLAKFLRRSAEIGVRRALGATRRTIFAQFLIESSVIGLAGGALGLILAFIGLWGVRQQPTNYAEFVRFDGAMLLLTVALTLLASVLAGILPAWRACQVTPAIQLKSQ